MAMQFNPGRYFGRIKNQGFGKTKDQQTDTFWVQFDIIGAINPADPEGSLLACNPGERTCYWTLKTDKNAEYFVKDMRRLGCPMTSFGMLDPGAPNFHDLSGVEHEFVCEANDFNGKVNERWRMPNSNEGPQAVPLNAKEARRLDGLFGKALKTESAQPKSRSVAPAASNPAPASDPNGELLQEDRAIAGSDDIPF